MSDIETKDYSGPNRRGCPGQGGCKEAEMAAESAVRKVFAILGVDVDRPDQVRNFQESLRFGEDMRKYANRGLMTFVVVFSAAAAAAFILGVKVKLLGDL